MSDYFLNKVYDTLLANKSQKTKSAFRTLSEAYNLIREQESEQPPATDVVPAVNNNVPSKPVTDVTPKNEPPVQQARTPFNFPSSPLFDVNEAKPRLIPWSGVQQNLFKYKKTGTGNGEYSVASVVAGCTEPEDCELLVSGQSLSYDVSLPPETQLPQGKSPAYKFEVKELETDTKTGSEDDEFRSSGSVRIGREGESINRLITKTVEEITTEILNVYNVLDDTSKQIVDQYIISQVKEEEEPNVYTKDGKMRSDKKILKRHTSWNLYQDQKMFWTVDRWANGIRNNLREIPFKSVLFGPDVDKITEIPRTSRSGYDRETNPNLVETRLIFTLKQFIELINKVQLNDQEAADPEDKQTRVGELSKTFKQFYGASENEKSEINQILDQEAYNTDRRLTKLKVSTLKTGYKDFAHFIRDIRKLNLQQKLNDLYRYIYQEPNTILNMFPEDLTGLFVINSNGYHYIPRMDLPNYIYIDQISSGGPKIKLGKPTL